MCIVFLWYYLHVIFFFFFSSRRRHTRFDCDWSSDVCSSDLTNSTSAVRFLGIASVSLIARNATSLVLSLNCCSFTGGSQSKIPNLKSKMVRCLRDVLVASPGTIHDDDPIGRQRRREPHDVRDALGGFECGNDPLSLRQRLECAECFVVGRVNVFDALLVAQITVLGPNRGIIQP